jgi:uncharacterized protein YkwD
MALIGPALSGAGDNSQLALTELELSTIQSINSIRAVHGVGPLTVSPALFGSAVLHDQQMLDGGYFSHLAPDGSSFAARLAAFYPMGRYQYYSVGENLLYSLQPMTGDQMVAAWMKSTEHRTNLLNPAWRQVAVAAISVPSAPGIFNGQPVTVVTVDFGVRR